MQESGPQDSGAADWLLSMGIESDEVVDELLTPNFTLDRGYMHCTRSQYATEWAGMYINDTTSGHSETGQTSAMSLMHSPPTTGSHISQTRPTASLVAGSSRGRCSAPGSSGCLSESQCHCLSRIALLLDDFESPSSESRTPDVGLASLKEALRHMLAMLGCAACTIKLENMTLLTLLVLRLVNFFQVITVVLQPHTDMDAAEAPHWAKKACVGEYEIDTAAEWNIIMRALAQLLAQRLHVLAHRVQNLEIVLNHESLRRRIATAQDGIVNVLAQLQNWETGAAY